MKKLLIVDDEAFARSAIEDIIKSADQTIQIFTAADGKIALEIIEKEKPYVVITDIKMPVMNGMELFKEIRNRGLDIQVIILSSYNEFELTRQAIQLGAFDYLFKPAMLPEDILEVVQKAFSKQMKQSNDQKVSNMIKSNADTSMSREMRMALEYIKANLHKKDLSLQTVSEYVGLSKNYFSKLFKDTMGTNFIDYITKLRAETARSLYISTDMKIYEIAEAVGYSDWHYLYSIYKKIFGHSMSQEKRRTNTNIEKF